MINALEGVDVLNIYDIEMGAGASNEEGMRIRTIFQSSNSRVTL
jgi:hypothetical protein